MLLFFSSSEKSTVRRVKRILDSTQYQIDAGQKKFGGFLCKQCGLYYSRGEPEDEAEHDKYHSAQDIFKYNVSVIVSHSNRKKNVSLMAT